jgi:hypothetical protein
VSTALIVNEDPGATAPAREDLLGIDEEERAVSVAADSGTMFVKLEQRFTVTSAEMLRTALTLGTPVRRLTIDFCDTSVVEDAALCILAEILSAHANWSVELHALSRHQQRVLRYSGLALAA